ncbi:TPA: hypothetical protein RG647_RS15360 [Providencia rettgeri]|nr:hypothetical protein [Providencia rettgeri]
MGSQRKMPLGLFPIMIVLCFLSSIKHVVASLPTNSISYGQVQVYANLFSTACNLSISGAKEITLTNCGAGSAFDDLNLFNSAAYIPVTLQFYDTEKSVFYTSDLTYLTNGDNKIILPPRIDYHNTLRFEVNYE